MEIRRRSTAAVMAALLLVLVACSGGGGSRDERGARRAATTTAKASETPPKGDLRVVVLNLLHGFFCPEATVNCQGDDRVALLGRLLEESRCPDVVALQEIDARHLVRLRALRDRVCGGRYQLVWHGVDGVDRELVLTTLPVEAQHETTLAGGFRGAYQVRLRSPLAPVVLVVTHQDGDPEAGEPARHCGDVACDPRCTTGEPIERCQTDVAEALAAEGGSDAIHLLVGDFNVTATNPRYRALVDGGWIDTYLAAGNSECAPSTGRGCTSGKRDDVLDDMRDPNSKETERIDFVLLKTPRGCRAKLDPARDPDHDGLGTGLWADRPAVDGPGGLSWPSDHVGVGVDLSLRCTAG